jgi:hypothetical protein
MRICLGSPDAVDRDRLKPERIFSDTKAWLKYQILVYSINNTGKDSILSDLEAIRRVGKNQKMTSGIRKGGEKIE